VEHFVARAAQLADLVQAARSRRAFLGALVDFERMLTVTVEYPRNCFKSKDLEALRTLADRVIERIEGRVDAHADRAAVERQLVASIYRIRCEIETMFNTIRPADAAGNPSRNADRSAVVSPSR
jgi:hypothetical protein